MTSRFERNSAYAGLAAVVLWVAGLFTTVASQPGDHATDQQILTWAQTHADRILLGNWIFMVGCLCFVWFVGTLRSRLTVAEGGTTMLSSLAFIGGAATGIFGLAMTAGDTAIAIDKDTMNATTAGALHHLLDVFFVPAELSAILLLVPIALLGFRTGVVPKWWAAFGALIAVVLLIGPIGWAGLIYGVPLWTLGTTLLLVRGPRVRRAAVTAGLGQAPT